MSTRFVALADTGEEVAAAEAHGEDEEPDALLMLTARALTEAPLVGSPLRLVVEWPDRQVYVGRVEHGNVNWLLGDTS